MEEVKRVIDYTVKQYKREGFGYSYIFIDCLVHGIIRESVLMDYELTKPELEVFLDVFRKRYEEGEDAKFIDHEERKMNEFFERNENKLINLEQMLSRKMGKERFEKHYERFCYYLTWLNEEDGHQTHETFWTEEHNALMVLKMADMLGKRLKYEYRIVLSDEKTDVDPELLSFALCEK